MHCKTKAYAAWYTLLHRSSVMPSEGAPQVRDDHIAHKVWIGLLASLQGQVDTYHLCNGSALGVADTHYIIKVLRIEYQTISTIQAGARCHAITKHLHNSDWK